MSIIRLKVAILTLASVALLLPASPVVYAATPPWAPAHGWRQKHGLYYQGYSGTHWDSDSGIITGKCNCESLVPILEWWRHGLQLSAKTAIVA